MSTISITTQAEFDAAVAILNGTPGIIEIKSPAGVWITVRAFGSATVRAFGSATVRAFDSATVEAFGSATVRAFDSATVRASSCVAVHLHSAKATIDGGVLIDVTHVNDSAETWLAYHAIPITELGGVRTAILFKAVDSGLRSGRGWAYPIGEAVTPASWVDADTCGDGLHLSPTPFAAKSYFASASRFLACRVRVDQIRVITDSDVAKCKVPELLVLHEVDIDGETQ